MDDKIYDKLFREAEQEEKDVKLVECEQRRWDCMAYIDGLCNCLNDTHFTHKCCPFYKKRVVLTKEQKETY